MSDRDRPAALPALAGRVWRVGTLSYTVAGLAGLILWLLWGDFAWWLRERSAMPMVQLLLKQLRASDFITGIFLIMIPSLTMILIGPAVSTWSDRHRSRWGRRIPFLLATTPVVTTGMVGLGLSAELGGWLNWAIGGDASTLRACVLVMVGVSWTIFEIGALTANSVFHALINDVVPREMIGRFFGVFRVVSLGTGILFNAKIIGHADTHLREIFIGIGLVYAVGIGVMCLRVKEGTYPPPEPYAGGRGHPAWQAMRTYVCECFAPGYYLWGIAFFALGNLAFIPVNTFMLSAAKDYGMSTETYGQYFVAIFSCAMVLAYPLGWMADRFHPLRVGSASVAAYAAAALLSFALIHDARSFGWALLAHGVLSGCFFTGTAGVCQVVFPKLKFAQFAAAAWMTNSLCQIVLGPVLGAYLDLLGNDYRYTFLTGALLCLATLFTGLVMLRLPAPAEPAAAQVERS